METLVNVLFNLIEESNGFWITDNKNINGDIHDIYLEKDDKSIYMMYDNDEMRINFTDIIGITFDKINIMIVAALKIKNKSNLLIHIL